MKEVELLKKRILIIEEKGLTINQAKDRISEIGENLKGENIDEEYKSKKR